MLFCTQILDGARGHLGGGGEGGGGSFWGKDCLPTGDQFKNFSHQSLISNCIGNSLVTISVPSCQNITLTTYWPHTDHILTTCSLLPIQSTTISFHSDCLNTLMYNVHLSSSGGHAFEYMQITDCYSWSGKLSRCVIPTGYWRLLDADFRDRVVVRILSLLEEKGWSYNCVPGNECCEILSELEPRYYPQQMHKFTFIKLIVSRGF